MRPALFVMMALALPLAAQDSSTAAKPAAAAQDTAVPQAVAQPDSPLVAAAKRMNRKGRKPSKVITNDTLRQNAGSGHVTTTANQATLNMPPEPPPLEPTPEMAAAAATEALRKKAADEAAMKKKTDDEAQAKKMGDAEAIEDGYDGARDDASEFVGSTPAPPPA